MSIVLTLDEFLTQMTKVNVIDITYNENSSTVLPHEYGVDYFWIFDYL